MGVAIVGGQDPFEFVKSEFVFLLAKIAFSDMKLCGTGERMIRKLFQERGKREHCFGILLGLQKQQRLAIEIHGLVIDETGFRICPGGGRGYGTPGTLCGMRINTRCIGKRCFGLRRRRRSLHFAGNCSDLAFQLVHLVLQLHHLGAEFSHLIGRRGLFGFFLLSARSGCLLSGRAACKGATQDQGRGENKYREELTFSECHIMDRIS